ncbi:R-phycoerythrin gamma chain, chloroplastic [Porphyridium purpureum]|uniref:R-phycoerythrin gamma chain, chloroplastic n=1 Tax=Porphyridium purpureum TaxID=35688 RepID=A0A5J4YZM7_PORPP|nr:Chain A8, LR5 [Porphyridium purpureum]6KGX_AA Chain AA, LR5 [Porphyridium purpureum]6KGX_wE Chain wE, LR5 [Porphyridium purpureum]6KGX_wG Chain wG, LR5 [Porphyridium purpureum]6KGX_xE Chain xE, LR5 [Porphyridium purpureum]6KGX_xG Chain xG, LR5 [Porphyridium purpureum]7EZX_AB Chain AB, R-phycoerythrin gamma chain, chloroplastic [Porphyridium purpureum]7EZX_AM Chain AM, R-phycoerythrin gamma chain, chloroplastic [Porphyridium purpureum]7EZX_wJ Chain wJ, R-phycoerythrin gamma chain, chlorop|eukprot:POR4822..scf209_3
MAAFVGSAASAFTGASAVKANEKRSVCSLQMVAMPQTGLVNSKFSARMAKKTAKQTKNKVDEYMARSVQRQYKQAAVATGVYGTQCTEGTVKGAAEASRSAALSRQFRIKQRSAFSKAHDLFEFRKHAIIAAAGCSYEEKMVTRFPKLAAAMVLGQTEMMRTCSRYVVPESVEEEYMAASVDKQMKRRGAPGGVYSLSCAEGVAKGQAEIARVSALGAAYRAASKSASAVTAERYNSMAYGRVHFAHGCSYEEQQFNKYPAAAAAMRSDSYGY